LECGGVRDDGSALRNE
jgi:hypothetical protein